MGWGANKGEWSELYVFLKILVEGFAHEADKDLKKKDAKYDFVSLLRDDSGEMKVFHTRESQYGEDSVVSRQNLMGLTIKLFESIKNGVGSFELPEITHAMNALGLNKIKTGSWQKTDLLAKIKSPMTGEETDRGFSIKSQLGSPSTLVNASSHTRFEYLIPLTKQEIKDIWKTAKTDSIQDRLRALENEKVAVESLGAISPVLRESLSFWGEEFQIDLGQLFLLGYLDGDRKITSLCKGDKFGSEGFKYKVKGLLAATALGMTPSKPWNGKHPVHGGYIVLNKNGELLVLDADKGDDFRDYLFEQAAFETPSSSRHEVGTLQEIGGATKMILTMQIRFQP